MKPTLVFFSGWSMAESSYGKFKALVGGKYDLVFVDYEDLIPDGRSSYLNKRLVTRLQGRKNMIVVGHSLGGALAIDFAHDHAKSVSKLILANSAGFRDERNLYKAIRGFVYNNLVYGRNNSRSQMISLLRVLRRPLMYLRLLQWADRAHLVREARALRIPTAVLWGEKDRLFPVSTGRGLAALFRNSKFVVLKNQGHDWIVDSPEHILPYLF